MGLFTKDTKIEDPLAGEKKRAAGFLEDLMQQGTPDIPTQQVAGLTPLQQILQGNMQGQVNAANQNYGEVRDYYRDVLDGGYDPRSSDFYKGLRQEADRMKTEETTNVRQSANMGGMLQSTPRMAVESDARQQIDNQTLQLLGGLYENERGRQGQAATALPQLDAQRTQTTGAMQSIADVERQIEQQRNNAMYQQALQTVLFPYQYQANLANMIFGGSQPVVTGGGMTDLGFGLNAGAGAIASFAAAGGKLGGGGGNTSGGGGGSTSGGGGS